MLRSVSCVALSMLLCAVPGHAQDAPLRELHFAAKRVTRPDVTAFPDSGGVLFTLLGHLYRVSPEGGKAVQVTRGPFFHKEPAVSPDGRTVAVVSDRTPEMGDNIYVMDADGANPRRVTSETEAGRPAWKPDGTRLAFLAYERTRPLEDFYRTPQAQVRELDLATGNIADVTDGYGEIRDVTYAADGSLYWVRLRQTGTCITCIASDVERRNIDGSVVVVVTLDGMVEQLRLANERVFYTIIRRGTQSEIVVREGFDGDARSAMMVDGGRWRNVAPRFAVVPGRAALYVGDWGNLWEVGVEQATRRHIPFTAQVTQTVMVSAAPPAWTPPEEAGAAIVTVIADPVLSPDGQEIAFAAAGTVWRRPVGDTAARPQRITEGRAEAPVYAPRGGRVAYVRLPEGRPGELVVAEGWEGPARVVARGRIRTPAWSPDGTSLVFTEGRRLLMVPATDTTITMLTDGWPWYTPHMPGDGSWVAAHMVSSRVDQRDLIRVPLQSDRAPVPLTDIGEEMKSPQISSDGRWFAFQRNGDIWIADLPAALAGDSLITEEEVRLLVSGAVPGGGREGVSFSFDPRGDALVFVGGSRILRAALPGGATTELAGPFSLPEAAPASVVIRNVRVLTADGTAFSEPTDVFVDRARIAAVGAVPADVDLVGMRVVEGGGRFAVPGLWDAHLHGGWVGGMVDWVRHGVTAHRDPGSAILSAVQELDYDRAFGASWPRRFTSGEIFEGYWDNWWGSWHRVTDPDAARRLVRQWRELDVRFIKVYRSLPWHLHKVVADEARAQGLPVMGHGMFPEEMVRSITLGYRSLEHHGSSVVHDDVLQLMAEAGTFWAPQFTLGPVPAILSLRDPEHFARSLQFLNQTDGADVPVRFPAEAEVLLGQWALHAEELQRAYNLGVPLLLGTDNAGGPGYVHVEAEMFQLAGLSPADVLRIATLTTAQAEGVDNDLGTLEVGKLADLLLLDDNPLEDVLNLRMPWMVIRGGRVAHVRDDEGAASGPGEPVRP